MNWIKLILRFLLGPLFIFSGVVKLIDPKGTQIKLQEYIYAFAKLSDHYLWEGSGTFFTFFLGSTLFLALMLCTLEVILGVGILFWKKPKAIMWMSILLLLFFGFLTGYSAQCNPNNQIGVSCVTDCGCFGDFMKLKPIQSFYKDLFFLGLALPLFFFAYKEPKTEWSKSDLILLLASVFSLGFGAYNIIYEPIIDFRPYKIGNDIMALRQNNTPAKTEYKVWIEGKEKQVSSLPENTPYKYVGLVEISPEVPASIHDFYLYDTNGNDVTEDILLGNNTFILIKNAKQLTDNEQESCRKLLGMNKDVIILSCDDPEIIKKEFEGVKLFSIDETVLKTIARNYPTVWVIDKGIVLKKESINSHLKRFEKP
jgi:uncharacterized membrane protein YphA (DoxX/SURF4 family)